MALRLAEPPQPCRRNKVACHVETPTSGVFAGSPIIFCGLPSHATRCCRFCLRQGRKREGRALCDWPAYKQVATYVSDLKVNDLIRRLQDGKGLSKQTRNAARVIYIDKSSGTGGGIVAVLLIGNRQKNVTWAPYDRVLRLKMGTCSAPCCYRHRRHVGKDRDICMDHWSAQDEAMQ